MRTYTLVEFQENLAHALDQARRYLAFIADLIWNRWRETVEFHE